MSNVGCKCNAAMYFINMPGYENGNPYPAEWGVYYCDANFVNGKEETDRSVVRTANPIEVAKNLEMS